MAENKNIFQRIFANIGFGSSRIPLRSNVFNGGGNGYTGFNKIGSTTSRIFSTNRKSALLGNYSPSNSISGWMSRVAELKSYAFLDITQMAISLFRDYINNFLNTSATQLVTILDEEGNQDEQKTNRINDILVRDIKLFDYIHDNLDDVIFYGAHYGLLRTKRDEKGHLRFFPYGMYDPVSVIVRKKMNPETNEITEEYIARGDDGSVYTIPYDECFYLGSPNMRLENDLKEETGHDKFHPNFGVGGENKKLSFGKQENRRKVLLLETYSAGDPLFYSNILKIKELIVKELLVSLLSLRDLCTPSILALMFDKGVPMENAEELCNKVQRMLSSYNDLSSFLSAQFDVTSLIENILSQNVKVIPDFNATLQNKGLINTDKLGDKMMELMQTIDQSRQNVLSPLGIPASIMDGTIGNKWQILQSSERLNSKVQSFMTGLKESVTSLVRTIYHVIYDETIDSDRIKLHIFEKSTVEYNNSLNTLDSIQSLTGGIGNIIQTALQTLESSMPLIDAKAYISYIQNMIKDADPNAADVISEETIEQYINFANQKFQAQAEQMGINLGG